MVYEKNFAGQCGHYKLEIGDLSQKLAFDSNPLFLTFYYMN